jgi:hypothetical protein
MRPAPNAIAETFRVRAPGYEHRPGTNNGMFICRHNGITLRVVCSDGDGWDHISVSLPDRCPTWEEMEYVRELFFRPDETVMQLHPSKDQHINNHPYCLHLWRPHSGTIPTPPGWMVGVAGLTGEDLARMSPAERRRAINAVSPPEYRIGD